jgi:hypothetical protein
MSDATTVMDREFIDHCLSYEPSPLDLEFFEDLTSGDLPGVQKAVNAGISIENFTYGSALVVAAWYSGSRDVCQFLIDRGARFDAIDRRSNRTVLHGFACNGWRDLVAMAIAHGCPVNHVYTRTGQTALDFAEANGRTGVADLLIQLGASRFLK